MKLSLYYFTRIHFIQFLALCVWDLDSCNNELLLVLGLIYFWRFGGYCSSATVFSICFWVSSKCSHSDRYPLFWPRLRSIGISDLATWQFMCTSTWMNHNILCPLSQCITSCIQYQLRLTHFFRHCLGVATRSVSGFEQWLKFCERWFAMILTHIHYMNQPNESVTKKVIQNCILPTFACCFRFTFLMQVPCLLS